MRVVWVSIAAAGLALVACRRGGPYEASVATLDVSAVPRTMGAAQGTDVGPAGNQQHEGALETPQHTHLPR